MPTLRTTLHRIRRTVGTTLDGLLAVGADDFRAAMRRLGVVDGKVLFVQSSSLQLGSIRVGTAELVELLCEAVGEGGTVVMPTYPMAGRSQDYLDDNRVFDVRRTPSRCGLLSEAFRRTPGVRRSLHPTHPIAALGGQAAWLTQGHELCETPFDEGSPFQKMLDLDALNLRLGSFPAVGFRHLAEHLNRDRVPYPLYSPDATTVELVGDDGSRTTMTTHGHNRHLEGNPEVVLELLEREKKMRSTRIGRVSASLMSARSYVDAYQRCLMLGSLRYRSGEALLRSAATIASQ